MNKSYSYSCIYICVYTHAWIFLNGNGALLGNFCFECLNFTIQTSLGKKGMFIDSQNELKEKSGLFLASVTEESKALRTLLCASSSLRSVHALRLQVSRWETWRPIPIASHPAIFTCREEEVFFLWFQIKRCQGRSLTGSARDTSILTDKLSSQGGTGL